MWIFWTLFLFVIGACLMAYSWTGDGWQGPAGMWSTIAIIIAVIILNTNTSKPKPTALDVYRGNTELKITSVNGIPTDTVVVFKNK